MAGTHAPGRVVACGYPGQQNATRAIPSGIAVLCCFFLWGAGVGDESQTTEDWASRWAAGLTLPSGSSIATVVRNSCVCWWVNAEFFLDYLNHQYILQATRPKPSQYPGLLLHSVFVCFCESVVPYEVRFLFDRSTAVSPEWFLLESHNFGNMYLSNSSSFLGNWILCGMLSTYFLWPLKLGALASESESCAVTEEPVCE